MNLDTIIAERKNKLIYRDGDKCIKVFNQSFSKADILNEALNQARVEDVGLNVPRILEVTTVDGKWAIVSEYIEGTTLSHLMRDDPENTEKYLNMLVDTQLLIHSKRSPLLSRLKDKMNRKILSADLEPVTRYELLIRLEGLPTHDKLCHGDLCPSNVILTPGGDLYIIDWAHATQGNASADAARTFLTFHLRGEAENADRYLDLFCEKSDTEKRYVQKWMPIVAASQSVKGNLEERDFLLRWANVVDYE
ncbi:MAG: phosphotransferase [Oscillospiraceae bacterium]|nr:phosphotransferase [Oscillospiraceae bacterium]